MHPDHFQPIILVVAGAKTRGLRCPAAHEIRSNVGLRVSARDDQWAQWLNAFACIIDAIFGIL